MRILYYPRDSMISLCSFINKLNLIFVKLATFNVCCAFWRLHVLTSIRNLLKTTLYVSIMFLIPEKTTLTVNAAFRSPELKTISLSNQNASIEVIPRRDETCWNVALGTRGDVVDLGPWSTATCAETPQPSLDDVGVCLLLLLLRLVHTLLFDNSTDVLGTRRGGSGSLWLCLPQLTHLPHPGAGNTATSSI